MLQPNPQPWGSESCDPSTFNSQQLSGRSSVTGTIINRLTTDLDQSFPELVDEHGAMVLTLATRLTDASTGPDIAQEVFLRAYRALDRYPATQIRHLELRPWLATITRNLVRNEYRRRQRRATTSLNAGAESLADQPDPGVEEFESRDRVDQLLAPLTEPQREAIVLRHIVGLPIREVALTMACPVGTAKSHVSRGLSELRQTLTEATHPGGDAQ